MLCQAGFDQWRITSMHHLSHLSKPQATVLALWSCGMVLARSCALTAVSSLLAEGMQRHEQTVRQRLREWYYNTPRQRGSKRQALCVERCFAPLVGLGGELVAGHAPGVGYRRDDLGPARRGAGRQRGLSRRCDPCGVGAPARGRQARLAPRMAAPAASTAPGHPAGVAGERAG